MIQSRIVFDAIVPVLLFSKTIQSSLADSDNYYYNNVIGNEFPFEVSIQALNSTTYHYQHQCFGSIINKRYVLTAAHCFYNTEDPSELSIMVGNDILNTSAMRNRYFVAEIIKHKYFKPYEGFDIALVKLTSRLPLDGKSVAAVTLNSEEDVKTGQQVYTVGRNRSRKSRADSPLVSIPHRAIDSRTCRNNKFSNLTKQEVCAIASKALGPCDGDSGSPLMSPHTRVQWGVLSYSRSPCKPNRIYVFTLVQPFIGWINETIKHPLK